MRQISAQDIRDHLPMPRAIALMRETMCRVSDGQANLPLRSVVDIDGVNKLGVMSGVLRDPTVYGVKLLSLFPGNPAKGRSSHLGVIILFDAETGEAKAALDADAITAIRTAAASAAASDALARADATRLAIIGTGEQAVSHIDALRHIRPLTEVIIAGRSAERAHDFVQAHQPQFPSLTLTAAPDARAAAEVGDIVCTVTSSAEIVLRGDWIRAGQHVNAVGASVPMMQEIDEDLVQKARRFTDFRPSALAQARDIMNAVESHAIGAEDLTEIGTVFDGTQPGRQSHNDITLYRSLGIAAQDLACADFVLKEMG